MIFRIFGLVVLMLSLFACNNSGPAASQDSQNSSIQSSQKISVTDFAGLEPLLNMEDDSLRVFNFWATWCKPCVEELPLFDELYEAHKNEDFKLYFISLDFPNQVESKLKPFLITNPLQGEVILLDDPDANSWIDKVNPDWSGAIPATVVKKGPVVKFKEGQFSSLEELQSLVSNL